jgi:demethylmenaquinone methyltransferase/2-methoxy-6-polyprenyl-1,4-benzoquinol methylase
VEAKTLFAPLGPTYERYATLLSYGQDPRWRRFLVSRVDAGPGDRVLDVATGTGMVARELVRQKGCTVVGVDQSAEMLAQARGRAHGGIELVEASAESLPFADGEFDALTFTYLLRYVDDPASTLAELARVVRTGGTIAGLEFGLPQGVWRPLWELHVRVALPGAGLALGGGWREVGSFLGRSIRGYRASWPLERQLGAWRDAGIDEVSARTLSVGGGVVTWGRKR